MPQVENRKVDKKLATGMVGAAVMLITLGAGCAPQSQPSVQVDTNGSGDVQVTPLPPTDQPTPEPTPAPAGTPPTPGSTSYKDGTYAADGSYAFHSGTENVSLTLTLKGGLVTDTTLKFTPSNPMSARFMGMFNDNYKAMVVGKSLDEVCALGKVSGSSLTPQGFDDACVKIQAKAKA